MRSLWVELYSTQMGGRSMDFLWLRHPIAQNLLSSIFVKEEEEADSSANTAGSAS
jgi:hypothetical protein